MTVGATIARITGGHRLTVQQSAAYRQLHEFATGEHGARMMTLEGYAGVGKTYLVSELVRELAGMFKIAVAAPTNKAVKVIAEKVGADSGADFGSIHSFLGLRLKEKDDGNHECLPEGECSLHQYDIAIIDESSMIGNELFGRIVMVAQANSTRVIFIGDPAQLPPVEKSTEPSPTFSRVRHKAVLTEVVRQAAGNPIIALSMEIRAAIEQGQRMTQAMIEANVPPPPADVLIAGGGRTTAIQWALDGLQAGNDVRILAYTNAAVTSYNAAIHFALHGSGPPFAPGETVIMQEANRGLLARQDGNIPVHVSLANSEELVVVSITKSPHPKHNEIPAWMLTLKRDTGPNVVVWMPVDAPKMQAEIGRLFRDAAELKLQLGNQRNTEMESDRKKLINRAWGLRNDFANVRHIYSMTIHKSQGSTLHTAIVDLTDVNRMKDNFSYNRALYVATTRAANFLAFVA